MSDRPVNGLKTDIAALQIIRSWSERNGFPPTVREVGRLLGFSSPSSAARVVKSLERRGWVVSADGKARTMRVTTEGNDVLDG